MTVDIPHVTAGTGIENLTRLEDGSITVHKDMTSLALSLVSELDRILILSHDPIIVTSKKTCEDLRSRAYALGFASHCSHPQYTIEITRKQEKSPGIADLRKHVLLRMSCNKNYTSWEVSNRE